MRLRSGFSCVLVTAALLARSSAPALAADAGEDEIARGMKAMDRADFAGALDAFRAANEKSGTAESLARIGLAEQGLKRWVDADLHLNDALTRESEPWIKRYRKFVEEALAEVGKHIGSIDVTGQPSGAIVKANGEVIGIIPFRHPRKLAVGTYEVQIAAEGHETWERTIQITPGQSLAIAATLIAKVAKVSPTSTLVAPPIVQPSLDRPASQPPQAPSSMGRTLAWISAGGAVVALGTGAVLQLGANGRFSEFDKFCVLVPGTNMPVPDPDHPGRTQDQCSGLYDSWRSQDRWAVVGYVTGGVFVLASAMLFLTIHSESAPRGTQARLACGPGLETIVCGGSF